MQLCSSFRTVCCRHDEFAILLVGNDVLAQPVATLIVVSMMVAAALTQLYLNYRAILWVKYCITRK